MKLTGKEREKGNTLLPGSRPPDHGKAQLRAGINITDITHAHALPPIEVPPCLDYKTYIEHFINNQSD